MRFALKSTLALIALYLVALGGLGLWMERELGSVTGSLMEETAQLVGSEVAAAMSGSALDELAMAGPVTHLRLTQLVADLAQASDVVSSITVVNESGQVVVSDELEIGRQLMIPAVVFAGTTEPQFLSAGSPFTGGTYHLFVPLLREHDVVGYIRLSLRSQRIAELYRRARRQVGVAGLLGLAAIVSLGVVVHVRLSRRGQALAAALEATARGEAVSQARGHDEFSEALEAAGRLGRELNETRERSTQAQRRISALATFMDVGLLLLSNDRQLEFANPSACDLLDCDAGELHVRWAETLPLIASVLDRLQPGSAGSASADIELPVGDHMRRLRFEAHRPSSDEREGFLVLVKDRDLLEAYETDLRLATQMRGLARVYSALAHELKAPLGAMALNLDLLTDALLADQDDRPDTRQRQQRYARVLREELDRLNRSLVALLSQTASVDAQREPFDLCEVLRDLEILLSPQARQQRVQLTVELPNQVMTLSGHRDRLKQALLNIATNAIEAMPDGGRMEVSLQRHNSHASVSIRDSGPGIPADILGKIYGMYFTTKDGGTGIGLYVARSIVESHGGEIRVDSDVECGTRFLVTLPLPSARA
jgi:signal transduction histidine kinase